MVLGFVNDLTINETLDDQLINPSSGVYINSGVHSSVTLKNLLSILPKIDFSFDDWDNSTTYGDFLESRAITDIVTDGTTLYQSKESPNVGNALTDTAYWLPTNEDSIRLKIFIQKVTDRVYNDLSIEKKLVNNQYLYEIGDTEITLPDDYAAWTFEARGSDYVKFRMNQIAIQANTTGSVDVYVVNQGTLVSTISVPVNNGVFAWNQIDYEFSGHGPFHFAIDSQSVQVGDKTVDPFNFEGFIGYTSTGTGSTPESAEYSDYMVGVGIGVNLTVYFDPQQYIDNNTNEFARFIRAAFVYSFFETLLNNSGVRSNDVQRILVDAKRMSAELMDKENNTVGGRYHRAMKEARTLIRKAHDVQLAQSADNGKDSLEIETGSM